MPEAVARSLQAALLLLVACNVASAQIDPPTIFGASAPALPDDTVILTGDALGRATRVELTRLPDGPLYRAIAATPDQQ